jgi:signal transduction histidine kinase
LVPVALAVAALLVVPASHTSGLRLPTTYSAVSNAALAADLLAGLALLAIAVAAFVEPTTARLGVLASLTALAWFAPDVEGWAGGPAFVRSLGAAAAPVLVGALFLLVLSAPHGRLHRRPALLVMAFFVLIALARALVRDPLLDPHCWRDCYDHSFLLSARPGLASALDRALLVSTVAVGALLFAAALIRLAGARRLSAAPLVIGAVAGAAEAAYAVVLLRDPEEDPRRGALLALFYLRAGSIAALAVALLAGVALVARRRRRVARLAVELGETPRPGRLEEALADAFGDPGLEVAYWLPGSRHYVDSTGRAVPVPTAQDGRAVTHIVRAERPVAAVVHDAALLGGSFEQELGSAARLAVENERLQAEVRAQLGALRASRMRITERGDAERRRLERDLHDGAQQRLLALSFDLRLARSAAESAGETGVAERLSTALAEAGTALEELRQLAHGIHPAVLTEAGLGPALRTLAEEAPVAVELGAVPERRFPPAAEAALYVAAREAIDDAARRGATYVRLDLHGDDARVGLSADDDGRARDEPLIHVEDRVGALGGHTAVGTTSLQAEVPCA